MAAIMATPTATFLELDFDSCGAVVAPDRSEPTVVVQVGDADVDRGRIK